MDAELILLPKFGENRSHFRVRTSRAIPSMNRLKFAGGEVAFVDGVEVNNPGLRCGTRKRERMTCQPVAGGLILWVMTFVPASPAARTRCCCMRTHAGVLGDRPTG